MTSTSISAEGWHTRAVPHPDHDALTFQPTIDNLLFTHRFSAMCAEGFVMALFLPDIAVDSDGNVLKVQPQDLVILAALVKDVARLPDGGPFNGVWCLSSTYTCQARDHLNVKTPEGTLKQSGVYAWSPRNTALAAPTAGYEHLPASLHELVGYAWEAYAGGSREKKPSPLVDVITSLAP
ncbi:hypothetical protein DICSQDRAFT_107543 [Dichomitus squalens LYAD-421 SS1]|uniref:Uncharacterized protein n=1 Tax=Dichomitus squalens (strain LYAD-421) TaxID=732165 RepID=R7SW68_DICSQ|nr:uncharacterized protein DICSQDRAFT_107543 [Dichomitus squalens LYAD-421 SS1]EJF60449.1 hypothetical protein DICSQDRAFT_107543 [Dichomitus squalens LYAD-421 SS1]